MRLVRDVEFRVSGLDDGCGEAVYDIVAWQDGSVSAHTSVYASGGRVYSSYHSLQQAVVYPSLVAFCRAARVSYANLMYAWRYRSALVSA